MAIFARRVLQGCIDRSHAYASDEHRRSWVNTLNSPGSRSYAATEWEIVLLDAFSRQCEILHEQCAGGLSRLDLIVRTRSFSFGADIVAISDSGIEQRNPVEHLEKRLKKIYADSRITGGAIIMSIFDMSSVAGKPPKLRSVVPPISEFDRVIFNARFWSWLDACRAQPKIHLRHVVTYNNPLSQILFRYVPGRRGASLGECTNYRVARRIDDNSLYHALRDKANRLKKSGYLGPRGILVCDAGASTLREPFGEMVTSKEIIRSVLRRHSSIDFVATFELRDVSQRSVRQSITVQLYVKEEAPWHNELMNMFSSVVDTMPLARRNWQNAALELNQWSKACKRYLGGLTVTFGMHNEIKELQMSSRTLLGVLSGKITSEEFKKRYQLGDTGIGLFEHVANSGVLIESLRVERSGDEDDDLIIFSFGRPDPAVSAFRER